MLPETLSADVCSLKEGEDRAALACHLQVAKDGQLKSWRFTRARVRIAANIAYEDAQAAMDQILPGTGRGTSEAGGAGPGAATDGGPPPPLAGASGPPPRAGEEPIEVASSPCSMPEIEAEEPAVSPEIVETTLKPLWDCWAALYRAREKRAPLDLDLPERRVMLDEKGRITSVARASGSTRTS
jgi:ribonuclease R